MNVLKSVISSLLLRRVINREGKGWYNTIRQASETCKIRKLSRNQIQQIEQYYKFFGVRNVVLKWHEYYYSMTGDFFKEIIPDDLHFVYILPYLNDEIRGRSCVDKSMYDVYLSDVLRPRTILKNVNGYYYAEGKALTREEAITRCSNLQSAIIKPAIDSWCGLNVCKFSVKEGISDINQISIGDLFQRYNRGFIIQEVIAQHPVLAALNPTSVNTIRILTYRRLTGEVVVLSSVVRVGRWGKIVDNGHAGGFCCGIQENGWLKDYGYAFVSGERKQMTDNGTVFKTIQVPQFEKIVSLACRLHERFPYLRLIGWDFTVNNDNEIIFIELNDGAAIDIMQLANGPVFGDYTDEILQEAKDHKFRLKFGKEIIR